MVRERLTIVNTLVSSLVMVSGLVKLKHEWSERKLPEAISLLNEAVEVGEKIFPGSVLLADAYHNLAHNYSYSQNVIDSYQALEYYNKALNLKIACLGEQHFSTSKTYYGIGVAYFISGRHILAAAYLEKSLDILLNCPFEEADLLIIKSYTLLGNIYKRDNYSDALECYKEALSFVSKLPEAKKEIRASYITHIEDAIKHVQEKLAKQ